MIINKRNIVHPLIGKLSINKKFKFHVIGPASISNSPIAMEAGLSFVVVESNEVVDYLTGLGFIKVNRDKEHAELYSFEKGYYVYGNKNITFSASIVSKDNLEDIMTAIHVMHAVSKLVPSYQWSTEIFITAVYSAISARVGSYLNK